MGDEKVPEKTEKQKAEDLRKAQAAEKRRKARVSNKQTEDEEKKIAKSALAAKGQEMLPEEPKKPDFPFSTKKIKIETDEELRKIELEDKILVGWDPDTRTGTIKV